MKTYIILSIVLALAFGLLMGLATELEQSRVSERILIGAAAGVLAGLASLYLSKAIAKSRVAHMQECSECDPRFRTWYYLGGIVLALYFGALMALQAVLPTVSARLLVATSAGIFEGIAFISLAKGVRASAQTISDNERRSARLHR